MDHLFFMNTDVRIGNGIVAASKEAICKVGKKALIVTGGASADTCGAMADISDALGSFSIPYVRYKGILPNPPISQCREAAELLVKEGCDFVIGIGGGSAMDAAKAICVCAKMPDIKEDELFKGEPKDALPLIAVGTTAGTGSEVTPYAVITCTDGRKRSIRGRKIYPVLSLGDPEYTKTLDDKAIRDGAADAFAHCMESYFNKSANEFSKTFAVKGLSLLVPVLETVNMYGTEGLDAKDRETLYTASIFAGLAIAVTGTAAPHGMSYFLTENHAISHGRAVSAYLPAFILHNVKCAPGEFARLSDSLARTEDELKNLIADFAPIGELTLSCDEIESLRERWEGNPSLKKCLGDFSPDYATNILKALFM